MPDKSVSLELERKPISWLSLKKNAAKSLPEFKFANPLTPSKGLEAI